jgi:hypothetical protein
MKYTKETIFVDDGKGGGITLTYYLSNNINEIENAVDKIIGIKSNLSSLGEMDWKLNPMLSKSVQDLMNNYNVDYSMTFYYGININRRVNGKWYFYKLISLEGNKKFYSLEKLLRKYKQYFNEN